MPACTYLESGVLVHWEFVVELNSLGKEGPASNWVEHPDIVGASQ